MNRFARRSPRAARQPDWPRPQQRARHWAVLGTLLGLAAGLVAFAPAAWLASALAALSQQHLLLADARGTVWSGSAQVVLTGGVGSRDASVLPGRLQWTVGARLAGGPALVFSARQACCLNGTVRVLLQAGWGRLSAALEPSPDTRSSGGHGSWTAQWPSAWLGGLGTPWNTLQLGGALRLVTPGIRAEVVQGRWRILGQADLELLGVSSRVSTLPELGSYRFSVVGGPDGPASLRLVTTEGALRLQGEGTLGGAGLRFRGEASAAEASATALSNLLNIIGRRSGARSVISIG